MKKALNTFSAVAATEAIQSGACTSEQLVQNCLDRLQSRENEVHAWQYFNPEYALEQARDCDRTERRSALHGVPVGIKDIIDTADMPTDYGSAIFNAHQPEADARCIELLKNAGAVILGKTVTTEFAYLNPGPTRNPHNLQHTPGGSSSGSAAAVADQHVPLALGTQTAGSIIRPASYCGVVAYKPSFDSYSSAGIHPFAPSLDTLGGFARSVADLGLLANVLANKEIIVETRRPKSIAMVKGPAWSAAEEETHELFQLIHELMSKNDISVQEVQLPLEFDEINEAQRFIQLKECTQNLNKYYENTPDKLSEKLRLDYEYGMTISDNDMRHAYELVENCKKAIKTLFANHELIVTPASAGSAPLAESGTGDPVFNRMWTAMHLPCVNLPVWLKKRSLPLGIQLVGEFGQDARVLSNALCIEQYLSKK
ncbi:MAG: amidase [Gammaproteobacteria bacterium]|nr:amidase [Gammaproteobacteria bacterium]